MSPEKCRDFRETGPRIASNQMNLKFNNIYIYILYNKRQEVSPHTGATSISLVTKNADSEGHGVFLVTVIHKETKNSNLILTL